MPRRAVPARNWIEKLAKHGEERREREAASRDEEKPKESGQTRAVSSGTTSPDNGNLQRESHKDEPKSQIRSESRSDLRFLGLFHFRSQGIPDGIL
jgi:hypothetical protein